MIPSTASLLGRSRPPPGARRAMHHQARLFLVALQFLTRVPVPAAAGFEPAWLNASARYFPAVGAVVGLVAAAVFWAAGTVFTPGVAAGLSIAATLLLTGAFHEDGLADTCDALGGAVGRERALEIMKDSRIGSYGAIALVVVLGLKATTLATMAPALAVPVTVFAHAASRLAPVLLIRGLAYAGDVAHAKAKPMAQRVSAREVAVAALSTAVIGVAIAAVAPHSAVPIALGTIAVGGVTVAAAGWLGGHLGGYTGDTLGATQQIAELAALLLALAVARA